LLIDHWETEDVEKKYIFEALELLSKREDILMNEESVRIFIIQLNILNTLKFYFFSI